MSGRITRKDFLRIAGLAALAPGVTPLGATDRLTPRGRGPRMSAGNQLTHGPLIRTLDPVKRLYPGRSARAHRRDPPGARRIRRHAALLRRWRDDVERDGSGGGRLPSRGLLCLHEARDADRGHLRLELHPTFSHPHRGILPALSPAARRRIRARPTKTPSGPSASSIASSGFHSRASSISVVA